MSEELMIAIRDSFTSQDRGAVENANETLYHMVLESLHSGAGAQARRQLSDFYRMEEQLTEFLGLADQDAPEERAAAYYFGQMKAVADLLADLVRLEEERRRTMELSNRFKYLKNCLYFVDRHPRTPGKELKQYLNLSSSGFSNFMKRAEPYQLFYVQKIGAAKYYSLSPLGRRCLQSEHTAEKGREWQVVTLVLEYVADELKTGQMSPANVILRLNRQLEGSTLQWNTQLLRQSINRVFRSSVLYAKREQERRSQYWMRQFMDEYEDGRQSVLLDRDTVFMIGGLPYEE